MLVFPCKSTVPSRFPPPQPQSASWPQKWHTFPSMADPLQGGCLCGGVRFEVSGPILSAGYCHCTHCQKRTGTASSLSARVAQSGFRFLQGTELLRSYKPPVGIPKVFCVACGSSLFSGDPLADDEVAVRFGAFDEDPGIRPQYRQFVDSAAVWEPIPDDDLPRYPRSRHEHVNGD